MAPKGTIGTARDMNDIGNYSSSRTSSIPRDEQSDTSEKNPRKRKAKVSLITFFSGETVALLIAGIIAFIVCASLSFWGAYGFIYQAQFRSEFYNGLQGTIENYRYNALDARYVGEWLGRQGHEKQKKLFEMGRGILPRLRGLSGDARNGVLDSFIAVAKSDDEKKFISKMKDAHFLAIVANSDHDMILQSIIRGKKVNVDKAIGWPLAVGSDKFLVALGLLIVQIIWVLVFLAEHNSNSPEYYYYKELNNLNHSAPRPYWKDFNWKNASTYFIPIFLFPFGLATLLLAVAISFLYCLCFNPGQKVPVQYGIVKRQMRKPEDIAYDAARSLARAEEMLRQKG